MIQFPITGDWQGCYGKTWKGFMVDQAISHPAKFSRALIWRIANYLTKEDLVEPGGTILDPFAGVASGVLPILKAGMSWVGVELEQKFVDLGHKNIALWESKYRGKLPNWTGQAILLQGDSRRLVEVLQQSGIGAVVSSPPYADGGLCKNTTQPENIQGGRFYGIEGNTRYGNSESQLANLPTGNLQAVITSSPFAGNSGGQGEASRNGIDPALFDRHQGGMVKGLGGSNGNLGAMQPKQSDLKAIVTSSPFVDSVGSDDPDKRGGLYRDPKRRDDVNLTGTYGDSDGQLGAMKAGEIKGVIGSPPYEDSVATDKRGKFGGVPPMPDRKNDISMSATYDGNSDDQIGATSGNTFWSAARLILEQCYLLLPVDSTAVFVCKDFVKNGEKVEFSSQWAELCRALGFVPYAHFRAWQVKPGPIQKALIGEDVDYSKAYKSFFRRLHEKKNPAISVDWEDVLIFRKEQI